MSKKKKMTPATKKVLVDFSKKSTANDRTLEKLMRLL